MSLKWFLRLFLGQFADSTLKNICTSQQSSELAVNSMWIMATTLHAKQTVMKDSKCSMTHGWVSKETEFEMLLADPQSLMELLLYSIATCYFVTRNQQLAKTLLTYRDLPLTEQLNLHQKQTIKKNKKQFLLRCLLLVAIVMGVSLIGNSWFSKMYGVHFIKVKLWVWILIIVSL